MISDKMAAAINSQINAELQSAYLYLAMAYDAIDKGFQGAANWFKQQFEEEQEHAFKFMQYLEDRDVKVVLTALETPQAQWPDLLTMFNDTLAHEKKVTALINDLNTLAIAENDYATQSMLKWFIDEQVEEEASAMDVIWKLEMSADSNAALLMVDRELAKREDD